MAKGLRSRPSNLFFLAQGKHILSLVKINVISNVWGNFYTFCIIEHTYIFSVYLVFIIQFVTLVSKFIDHFFVTSNPKSDGLRMLEVKHC